MPAAILAFIGAIPAFIKALPMIMELMNKLVDGATLMAENMALKHKLGELEKAIKDAKENNNTSSLDNLFNGK